MSSTKSQRGDGQAASATRRRPRRSDAIETKPFFLTSEFVGGVLVIVGIAITAVSSDAFGAWRVRLLASDRQNTELRDRPLGEVARDLTRDVSLLVRQEVELAKAEMGQKGRKRSSRADTAGSRRKLRKTPPIPKRGVRSFCPIVVDCD